MIACWSMPMNRTDRLGSYSSGMGVWCSPMTPWSFSPVRMTKMEVVFAAVTGILSQGKIGHAAPGVHHAALDVAGSG